MSEFQPSEYSYGDLGAMASTTVTKSQNGWPASPSESAIDVVPLTLKLRNGTKTLKVASRAKDAFEEIITWWDENIEPIDTVYGHNYRTIRGYTTTISNHGSGTAIDINATKHPLGASGTVSTADAIRIVAKAATLGLRWGGSYSGRKDEMHFEVLLPPAEEMFKKGASMLGLYWAATGVLSLGVLGVVLIRKKKQRRHERAVDLEQD